jgi:hypothetical protein
VIAGAPIDSIIRAGPERVVTVLDRRITESSGLAVSPTHADLVWSVDDSGTAPVAYGVSTRTGRTRAVLRLAGTDVRDPEALAAGRDAAGRGLLWIGDIGDNSATRPSVVLRLIREPTSVRSRAVPVVSLRVRYPGGPADAEALVWTPDGRLLVITKALLAGRVFQVPPDAVRRALAGRPVADPATAVPLGSVPQTLVTDAVALPDGRVVVRDYGAAVVYRFSGGRLSRVGALDLPAQPQGETVAAERGGRSVLVGSEGVRQPLWRVAVPGAPGPAPKTQPGPSIRPPSGPAARSAAGPTSQISLGGFVRIGFVLATGVLAVGVLRVARRRGRRRR